MTSGIRTVIYPVTDIARAKEMFGKLLDRAPDMDEPYYVGFTVGNQHVGLDPQGHSRGLTGPLGYWHVDDIEQSLQLLLDAGAEVKQAVNDVGGGRLVASVTDADGNPIGLLQDP
jgi:predicted enzyme related to lactoylglutathione lyase